MPPSRRRRDPSVEIEEVIQPSSVGDDATTQLQRIKDKVVAAETIARSMEPEAATSVNKFAIAMFVLLFLILVRIAFVYMESVSR